MIVEVHRSERDDMLFGAIWISGYGTYGWEYVGLWLILVWFVVQ